MIWLFKDYENKHGTLPTTKDMNLKNNLPQSRILNNILKCANKTYCDFFSDLGKTSHVRCDKKDYDIFLKRYLSICNDIGRALREDELNKNNYPLPSINFFVKYCPDKNVKTYNDFVLWCGFNSNKLKKDDDFVSNSLIDLEKKLGRPIIKEDITLENVGFTNIVVTRIFGSLSNAKKQLNLKETKPKSKYSFDEYCEILKETLLNIKDKTGRTDISWSDIENPIYYKNNKAINHKTYMNIFKKNNADIYLYIKNLGFSLGKKYFSNFYIFEDGERTTSSLEYDFSKFLRDEYNFIYGKDYYRNVMYKEFTNHNGKMDCDYCIHINNRKIYIELAGMIYNPINGGWRNHTYSSKRENGYRDKMIEKENLLIRSNCDYLFLFSADFKNNKYKSILKNKLNF